MGCRTALSITLLRRQWDQQDVDHTVSDFPKTKSSPWRCQEVKILGEILDERHKGTKHLKHLAAITSAVASVLANAIVNAPVGWGYSVSRPDATAHQLGLSSLLKPRQCALSARARDHDTSICIKGLSHRNLCDSVFGLDSAVIKGNSKNLPLCREGRRLDLFFYGGVQSASPPRGEIMV